MAKISPERKTAYYMGNLISVIGVLLFLSNFFITAFQFGGSSHFEGDFSRHFESRRQSMKSKGQSMMFRAIGGMALIAIGQLIANVGKRGLAGSGVILDPEQAREDLKPYSHQAGGMLSDTLEKADLKTHLGNMGSAAPQQIVKIKCRDCGFLNEEDSKFCQECGGKI